MNTHIYIDKGVPIASKVSETLSDKSVAWNISFNARELNCIDEKRAFAALALIKQAICVATGQEPLVL